MLSFYEKDSFMTKNFKSTERYLLDLFALNSDVVFNNTNYKIISSCKPIAKKGECKTDLYLKLFSRERQTIELKISIKQLNAEFLENKISIDRSINIFGTNATEIIKNSTLSISNVFKEEDLVKFSGKYAPTIMMGWKFEILENKSGNKSGEIDLSESQLLDIYSGNNLEEGKRDASVNGEIISESGIATHILHVDPNVKKNREFYLNDLVPISEYIKDKKVFFACKALNYRVTEDKWDGDRPLCVWVDWKIINKKLIGELIFDNPLTTKGNYVGENIRKILSILEINKTNFENIHQYLSNN